MAISYFIKGILIGFSLAIPVGPIGLLLIRRTLTHGRMAGLVSGLGAATADGIYGSIAGFGLTLFSNFLMNNSLVLRLMGGAFLCYLGVRIFVSKPREKTTKLPFRAQVCVGGTIFPSSPREVPNSLTLLGVWGV
jgi:threonine/homoserine/homoserine lactone efflux protein